MSDYKTGSAGKASIPAGTGGHEALCLVCGQPSEESICPACADKIRAEAVADITGEAPKARSKPGRRRAK